jgi:hypothetical protein
MTYGGAVSLTGVARGAGSVSLESKTAALPDWAPAGSFTPSPDGAFSTIVRPQTTMQFRLAWGDVRAGLTKIAVAPRIDATVAASVVSGSVRPALAAAPVQLQRQSGAAWTTISSTVTDTAGAWSFAGVTQAGTYRVRCAPGQGLAAGVSAALPVQ